MNARIDENKLHWIKNRLKNNNRPLTIPELQKEFNNEFGENSVSYSTIHRVLVNRLGLEFKEAKQNFDCRNTQENKKYRFWFAHYLIGLWSADEIVISIDETGFSTYNLSYFQ